MDSEGTVTVLLQAFCPCEWMLKQLGNGLYQCENPECRYRVNLIRIEVISSVVENEA